MLTDTNIAGAFSGQERRRHVLFRTRNTEYHLRGDRCVAVYDPKTGKFIEDHPAIGRKYCGALRFDSSGGISTFVQPGEQPEVGDVLFFSAGKLGTELRTSAVCDIQRPPKDAVAHYLH